MLTVTSARAAEVIRQVATAISLKQSIKQRLFTTTPIANNIARRAGAATLNEIDRNKSKRMQTERAIRS
jgi:hypothetical protein